MTQETHRCGGSLQPTTILWERPDTKGIQCFYQVPALECAKCGELLIERDVAHAMEAVIKGVEVTWQPICVWDKPISSGFADLMITHSTQPSKLISAP